jgi:hypothetical protein
MKDKLEPGIPLPEEGLEKKLRRDLILIAIAGLLLPCGLCWASMYSTTFETTLIPLIHGSLVGLYTLFAFYQHEGEKDLTPRLWREVLVFCVLAGIAGLAITWLIRSVGWRFVPGILILVLGAWSQFLSGRRVWKSMSFSRQSVLHEVDSAELDMVSIRGSHPIYAQLVYRYAGDYRGQLRTDRIQYRMDQIQAAMEEGRFRAIVRYLPDNPQVHRLENWWIEKKSRD